MDNSGLKKYWMVHNPNHGHPTIRYHDKDAACDEARRMALKNPGQEFFVLEAVASIAKCDMMTRGDWPDGCLPF
jgi:hypothetical protein